jgi:hypothetical protein
MTTRNQLKSANEPVRMMWALWGVLSIETMLVQDKDLNSCAVFSEKHFIRWCETRFKSINVTGAEAQISEV